LPPDDVIALADLDSDFRISLSGATWNEVTRELWVVRGDGAQAWRLVEDGSGSWEIDDGGGANWSLGNLDLESVALADPVGAPTRLHAVVELQEKITLFDVSGSGAGDRIQTWDLTDWVTASGTKGSEALEFVPDDALDAWGFVDAEGVPRVSALGYGGLFFVGTQNGGAINVFDLSPDDDTVEFVGEYPTNGEDTSALDFDQDTGRLYVWHGGDETNLEIVRLSSTLDAGERRFDTEAIFDYPGTDNIEGMALLGLEDCGASGRPLVFTIDDGQGRALDVYPDWPLCRGA
jgi:hypothetical protein